MNAQPLIQNHGQNDKSFITVFPESKDPFKNPENDRVKALRFSAFTAPEGPSTLALPYCPRPPTLWRPSTEEDDSETKLFNSRSPLRKVALSSSSLKRRQTSRTMPHMLSMPQSGFQALILCGPGIGLSTFTSTPDEYPKALVSIANRPMVWYVLDWCYRMGVTDITLVTPPASQAALSAALAQNPYLTSLPSPSPDVLFPPGLDHTTPTAELLRMPQVQAVIKSDFLLLPCDLICDVPGETFLETYLTTLGGLGGVGTSSGSDSDVMNSKIVGLGGERSGRRGGLSIWYNTVDREESVQSEECDFMCTAKLGPEYRPATLRAYTDPDQPRGTLRKLVWAMPMSELLDKCEEDKSWKIRQSLLSRYGSVKCLTKFRDAHIYLFPYWVKDFARLNEDFESVSEDLVGTWAKAEWRKPAYRARFGIQTLFGKSNGHKNAQARTGEEIPIEEDIDLLSLSSTRTTRQPASPNPKAKQTALLASRVQADPDDSILSPDDDDPSADTDNNSSPLAPPILSYILPSAPSAPLIRRVDTTPILLSVSLLLARIPSLDESSSSGKHTSTTSPLAHQSKIAATATIAPQVTITRSDTLIDSNTTVASKCVIKSSVIGSGVSIGSGTRLTSCLIMEGATIGERCVLTGTVVGKKANIGRGCTLTGCEVQDGNALGDGTDGKRGEKFLVGGLEDEIDGEGGLDVDGEED